MCAGPLPSDAATLGHATCGYCSVSLTRDAQQFRPIEGAQPQPLPDETRQRFARFGDAISKGIGGQDDPREVLRAALREHLGLTSEAEVVTAVALGLAAEFHEDTGIDVSREATPLCRFAEAYIKSCEELARSGSAEINLPFLSADSSGPKHFVRTIDVNDILALSRSERAPSRGAPSAKNKKTKKWWWPF